MQHQEQQCEQITLSYSLKLACSWLFSLNIFYFVYRNSKYHSSICQDIFDNLLAVAKCKMLWPAFKVTLRVTLGVPYNLLVNIYILGEYYSKH